MEGRGDQRVFNLKLDNYFCIIQNSIVPEEVGVRRNYEAESDIDEEGFI